jgi:xanthine/uracil permease
MLMGILGKFGAVFGSMPPSVLGGMQVFLYSTIAVAGVRVLALIAFTRRNRFILTAALGIGFMDIVSQGFLQGVNLIVETPFIIAAVVGVLLNLVLHEKDEEQVLPAGYQDERARERRICIRGQTYSQQAPRDMRQH